MLCNLPPNLQLAKLHCLHEAIERTFEMAPIAFRCGRWGFDAEVARNIHRLGYRIDTSITPYTSWAQACGPDFSHVSPQPYMFTPESSTGRNQKGLVAEIPVSIGYLHGEFQACAKLSQRLRNGSLRGLKLGGLLSRLHVLRKVWLSPEMETTARMMQLVLQMKNQGYELLNLVFHSSALMAGCGPFVRTEDDAQMFLAKLQSFLGFMDKEGVTFTSLSEAARLISTRAAESGGLRASSGVLSVCEAGSV
jgi:hypothetical protein